MLGGKRTRVEGEYTQADASPTESAALKQYTIRAGKAGRSQDSDGSSRAQPVGPTADWDTNAAE